MKVRELKDKMSVDELVLNITAKQEPRSMRGGTLHVCNLTGEDDSGSVIVALWNEDIDLVKVGNTIKIKDGWTRMFNDVLQVSKGRNGTLEVLE